MTIDEYIDALIRIGENEAFRNLKDEGKIEPATLIMHPKHKEIIAKYNLDVDVLFSDICPEDKAYMVNDTGMKEEIKRNRALLYRGGDYDDD